jgi:hypothetical protein
LISNTLINTKERFLGLASTVLFSIYLSDLEKYFIELNGNPLELLSEKSVNELNVFIKLFVMLQNKTLEIVDSYSYLGLIFRYNGIFNKTREEKLASQPQKSIFSIYKSIRNQYIPIDLQLKHFDAMVEPILLYGSEIWGYENIKIIEQIHLQFCKRILKVRTTKEFDEYI